MRFAHVITTRLDVVVKPFFEIFSGQSYCGGGGGGSSVGVGILFLFKKERLICLGTSEDEFW